MRTEFIYAIIGVLLVVLAFSLLVFPAIYLESSEGNEKQVLAPIIFMGTFMLVLGMLFLCTSFYKFGNGKPKLLSDMLINHIYEVIGRVSIDKGKTIAVLREQSDKIRLFQFDAYPEATGAFIKIIILKTGKKDFQSFPPSKETSSSEKTSVVKDS